MFMDKYMNIIIVMVSASIVKMKGDQGLSNRDSLPSFEKLGALTKWMSDPPPKNPIVKPLIDDYRASLFSYYYQANSRETLRIEDRVNTLAYSPNIDMLNSQNCVALNYQWPSSQITLPSVKMSLDTEKHVDIQQLRISVPSGCIVVLVGGKYVQRMDDIVRMVEHITSQFAIKLVTYFAEKTEVMPLVDPDNLPAIVRCFTTKPKICPDAIYCRYLLKSRITIWE